MMYVKIECFMQFHWTKFFALMDLNDDSRTQFPQKFRIRKAFMQEFAKGQTLHDEFCEMIRK
jgi:hypothetical protein